MGWLDALLGRTGPARSRPEALFALTTAALTLQQELGWRPGGRAGLCLKPVTTGEFRLADAEIAELVKLAAGETRSAVRIETDRYRYRWIVLEDRELDDLVALVHLVARELEDRGFGPQLLAAVFRFEAEGGAPAFLIYNYKRARFYPFIPSSASGASQERAHDLELQFQAAVGREIPVEPDLSRWYPMWGIPL